MSSIYIQEPPTNGKVLLKTSVGELEVELWSKEAPKTCRNFMQLCLDKKYNGSLFHRLVKSFTVQCGENTTTSDCVEPIKNEFHSRLRFSRRGLVAMAHKGESEDTMEFFFTLDATPELQNIHTIFGKVSGETIYNLLKLNESQTDANERPLYPHKINKVKILHNPFEDLAPRVDHRKDEAESSKDTKRKREGVKNFKLISFGDEAEQDEQEVEKFPKDTEASTSKKEKSSAKNPERSFKESERRSPEKSRSSSVRPKKDLEKLKPKEKEDSGSDSDYATTVQKAKREELEKKKKEIQDEITAITKQYQKERKDKTKVIEKEPEAKFQHEDKAIQSYLDEKDKYKEKKLNLKGKSREDFTLSLLSKFKSKLHTALDETPVSEAPIGESGEIIDEDEDVNWLSHRLDFSESAQAVLAKDASKKEDDWYDIYDPRNPLNKRKRGAEKTESHAGPSSKKK